MLNVRSTVKMLRGFKYKLISRFRLSAMYVSEFPFLAMTD